MHFTSAATSGPDSKLLHPRWNIWKKATVWVLLSKSEAIIFQLQLYSYWLSQIKGHMMHKSMTIDSEPMPAAQINEANRAVTKKSLPSYTWIWQMNQIKCKVSVLSECIPITPKQLQCTINTVKSIRFYPITPWLMLKHEWGEIIKSWWDWHLTSELILACFIVFSWAQDANSTPSLTKWKLGLTVWEDPALI